MIKDIHAQRLATISLMLRELRFNYGLTQEQFAQQINKPRNSVSRAENSCNLTLLSLFVLLDGYEISLDEFFSGLK